MVTKDSLLGETVTEVETLLDGEEGMGETGMVMGLVKLGAADEGARLVGVVAGSEGAVV